jgi:hypothetical protein
VTGRGRNALPSGVKVVAVENFHYIGKWRYVAEVAVSGSTFDEQVQSLIQWGLGALAGIKAVPAPPRVNT